MLEEATQEEQDKHERVVSRASEIMREALERVAELAIENNIEGIETVVAREAWKIREMLMSAARVVDEETVRKAISDSSGSMLKGLSENPRWSAASRRATIEKAMSVIENEPAYGRDMVEAIGRIRVLGAAEVLPRLWAVLEKRSQSRSQEEEYALVRLMARTVAPEERMRFIDSCWGRRSEITALSSLQYNPGGVEEHILRRCMDRARNAKWGETSPETVELILELASGAGIETVSLLEDIDAQTLSLLFQNLCQSWWEDKRKTERQMDRASRRVIVLRVLEHGETFARQVLALEDEPREIVKFFTEGFNTRDWAKALSRAEGEMRNWLVAALGEHSAQ